MIKLSDDLKKRFVNALTDGVAMVVGYVDRNGDPHVSPYGSLHASGDDRLALWVRNPDGDLIHGIARNANVAVFYAQLSSRTFVRMRGRARVANDAAERARVFDGMHPFVQRGDPERKGVAIVIELDSAAGREADGTMFSMTR
ncbi:MAG TPA: pyridoxamine 5'-phosphate oxidase family protein [Pseudomonadales bacterium]|nr:pyridoxamine 5'-phosphate oxidase family protein [Pseudomonadales bacterium]